MNDKKFKRDKNKKFTHIKLPLGKIVSPLNHDDGIFKELCYHWTKTGSDISSNSSPLSLKRGILIVRVSSSPWIQQLQFMKSELMDYINASFDEEIVTDIKFKLG